ncbi:MAG TPA: phosphatase PAP2 family protein [Ilumatobacteraceae bacterium]
MNAIESFDEWGDAQLERLRGHPVADPIFKAASTLGDFSGIWQLISVGRLITGRTSSRQSLAFSALIGAESLVVNQGVKRLFGRIRPTESGDPRFPVRRPSTSSFPSGHASAAFFSAAILTAATGKRFAPVWYSTAAVVAVSRAYVRIHHPSDVVAGAAVGVALGTIGSRIFKAIA